MSDTTRPATNADAVRRAKRQRQQQARRAAKRASEGPKPTVARWGRPRLLDESNFPSKPPPKRPPRPEPAEPAALAPEERGVSEATTAQTASLLTVRPEGSHSPPPSAVELRSVRLGVDGPPAAVWRWPARVQHVIMVGTPSMPRDLRGLTRSAEMLACFLRCFGRVEPQDIYFITFGAPWPAPTLTLTLARTRTRTPTRTRTRTRTQAKLRSWKWRWRAYPGRRVVLGACLASRG